MTVKLYMDVHVKRAVADGLRRLRSPLLHPFLLVESVQSPEIRFPIRFLSENLMSTAVRQITAEQLAALPDDGRRYELVRGELRMMSPAGSEHGRIAANVLLSLAQHVKQKKLGTVYAAETGFLLGTGPDTVRAPDVAFVRKERLDELGPVAGYLPLAPDFVAEVVSPNDSYSQVKEKASAWIDAGVHMVLVVDPVTRTVQVYRSADNIVSLNREQQLDASDVVSGWSLSVADIFEA